MAIIKSVFGGGGQPTITQNLDMNNYQIVNLADPTSAQDGATKNYVDEVALNAGAVSSVFGRAGAVVATTGDYTASQITYTPTSPFTATNVQAAIEEVSGTLTTTELDDTGESLYYLPFVSASGTQNAYINTNLGIYIDSSSTPTLSIGTIFISPNSIFSLSGPLNLGSNGEAAVAVNGGSFLVQGGNSLKLYNNVSSEYVGLRVNGSLATTYNITWPTTSPTNGYILVTDGNGNLSWSSGAAPSGTASGDLSGSYPSPTVAKINGATLGDTTALEGYFLVANSDGGEWVSVAMQGNIQLDGTGNTTIRPNVVTADMLIGADASTSSLFIVNPTQTTNTANYNTAFGFQAFQTNITGVENCAFGYRALQSMDNDSDHGYSSAFGSSALANQTTGENDAFGEYALFNTTTGTYNVAMGGEGLYSNISGDNNVSCGALALRSSLGSNNVSVGCYGMNQLTTGDGNVAVGYNTAQSLITGSNNTFVGCNAGGSDNITNSTAIGNNAQVSISNAIVFGNGACNVGIGTSAPSYTLHVVGDIFATGSVNKVTITQPASGSTLTIADGKTLTVSNTLTFTGTDSSSIAFGGGGTVTYTSNNLSVFASTTSAQLAGVISDETGSGSLVFATSPTLTTPNLGTPSTLVGTNISGTASSLTAGNATNVAITNNSSNGRCNIAFINASSGNSGVLVDDLNLNYNPSTATFRLGNNINGTATQNLTTSIGVTNSYGSGSVGVTNRFYAAGFNSGEIGLVANGAASSYNGIAANSQGIYIQDKNFYFTTNDSSGSTYNTAFQINNANRTFIFGAGIRYPVTSISGTYTILVTDYLIAVDTSAARSLTLPSASSAGIGTTFIVYDSTGNALTNNITINRAGSDTINGTTSKLISLNYAAKIFISNGTNGWYSAAWTGS